MYSVQLAPFLYLFCSSTYWEAVGSWQGYRSLQRHRSVSRRNWCPGTHNPAAYPRCQHTELESSGWGARCSPQINFYDWLLLCEYIVASKCEVSSSQQARQHGAAWGTFLWWLATSAQLQVSSSQQARQEPQNHAWAHSNKHDGYKSTSQDSNKRAWA